MALPTLGALQALPVRDHLDLLAAPVAAALRDWAHIDEVAVVAIDPDLADTAALSAAYDLPMSTGANCVVVSGRRAGEERVAACVVRADTRADVNNLVKRTLDVRKCSFLPMERATEESGMEYGGITPAGLPRAWRVLVDPRVADIDVAVLGSGLRRSKLLVPGHLVAALPGAETVEGLALES
ncbi:YbaK / prolyl-tRNA synthetases associated domain protein [Nocardioides dokdonensis FR1436]|uniref:YbaK / prolyl-tRNA synthetases associated domain protein n=1 Tax=Nocardioides dokdonensis FR1436 TaxID=1300347 RepID=A0A1A9GGH8_9ACTN|nr:YbaK/EbsC family protein [Nocardioides dokdonensis]ANH36742.1 YbaK / prolyl-tRNA synthetases associated domain protein [Nocardioides dokdonensis FR1436]